MDKKRVLSNDEFLKYKDMIKQTASNKVMGYALVLLKDYYNGSISKIANMLEASESEVIEAVENEVGIDLYTITEEEFLNEIPENQKEDFENIKKKLLLDPEHFMEQYDEGEFEDFENSLNQKSEEENIKVYEELSNCDLSHVLPESFYDCAFLEKINLENSGARLDMKNFNWKTKVKGSIKGCELISFRRGNFLHLDENEFLSNKLESEYLDKNQYLTVLEGIANEDDILFSSSDDFLFEGIENQSQIQWIFEKALESKFSNAYSLTGLLKVMKPDMREKNSEYFDRVISKSENDNYSLSRVVPYMNEKQFEHYYPDLLNFFTNEDGQVNFEKFIQFVYYNCSSEVQKSNFNKILDLSNDKMEDIHLLWNESSADTQKEYLRNVSELFRDKNGKLNIEELNKFLGKKREDFEIPNEYLQEVFNMYNENAISTYDFANFWKRIGKENQEKNLIPVLSFFENTEKNSEDYLKIWNNTSLENQFSKYDEVLEHITNKNPDLEKEFKGNVYINMVKGIPRDNIEEFFQNNMPKFLDALRERYDCNDNKDTKIDINNYNPKFGPILLEMDKTNNLTTENLNSVVENLPILGEELIEKVLKSNSEMISQYSNKIISQMAKLSLRDAEQMLDEVENVFSQRNLPEFMKIYKFFELAGYDDKLRNLSKDSMRNLSPVLLSTNSKKLSKRIIFSDLMRIAMDSNNKSLKNMINTLEEGNEIYIDVMKNGVDINSLTPEQKELASDYTKTLYFLYEETGTSTVDKRQGSKLVLGNDIKKNFETIGKRYSHDGVVKDLPDRILKSFIGPYQEIFEGIDSISKIKEYMQERTHQSNERHKMLADKKIDLRKGDMVKGINAGVNVIPDILSNGLRAGEFLGVSSHSDLTPLDTDFGVILESNKGQTLLGKILETAAGSYGDVYVVLKYDPSRIEYTRNDENHSITNEGSTLEERLEKRNEKETIRKRINDRSNGEYEPKKIEVFSSKVVSDSHYGVRTGIGSTDIDYIVLNSDYDKRIGYELAMSGMYIPIVDAKTEEVVFTVEDYENIRDKMKGMSYYDAKEFKIDESAFVEQAKIKTEELFPTDDIEQSISEKEAKVKRDAIQQQVSKNLYEKMGLGVSDKITGNLTDGFVEFIDTGSTGRGTNLPGDGDFDFTLKVDKTILKNENKLKKLKDSLREVLAIKSDDPESNLEELGGNFRYKKVKIEGLETPVDIDITFVSKDEHVTYSTDMAVKERLQNIKKSDPEGYKYTIANIVLAKKVLKERGLYKKSNSQGATEYGGFGGVGVENWILQNGGSLPKAIDTFLEASDNAKSFSEFKEIYPIFDFGQNHMAKKYRHDSFIEGLTDKGYIQMKEELKKIREELTPVKNETTLSKSIIEDSETLLQNCRMGTINTTIDEIKNAFRESTHEKGNSTNQSFDEK